MKKEKNLVVDSNWRDKAEWRRQNNDWLKNSQKVAILVLTYMEERQITQEELANRMGVTQQYVSKIVKGSENLSFQTVSKIESVLGISILSINSVSKVKSFLSKVKKMKISTNNDHQFINEDLVLDAD